MTSIRISFSDALDIPSSSPLATISQSLDSSCTASQGGRVLARVRHTKKEISYVVMILPGRTQSVNVEAPKRGDGRALTLPNCVLLPLYVLEYRA